MSDYHLNKIYSSLLNKEPNTKKTINEQKEIKKFQPLSKVYYNVLLQKITEDTDILMQQQPNGEVEEFKISDELAKKIRQDIRKEETVSTDQKQTTIKNEVDDILKDKGWKISPKEYSKTLLEVLHALTEEDVIPENFINFSEYVKQKENPFRNILLKTPEQVIEYSQLVPEWFYSLYKNRKVEGVINALWNVTPKLQPAIGNGEIAFTLLSDGKKGETGDLFFNDYGTVELKGLNGFMDGDGFVDSGTSKVLNEILSKQVGSLDISDLTLKRIKTEIINDLEKFKQERTKVRGAQEQNIEAIKKFIDSIEQEIENDTSVEELKRTIESTPKIIKEKLLGKLDKYLRYKRKTVKSNYRGALLTYFSMYNELTDEQLVEGVFAARNFNNIQNPEGVKTQIKNIILSEKSTMFTDVFKTDQFTYSLACLISALHACAYQEKKQFKGILFINDNNKKMVYYNFKSNSVVDNLSSFYKFLLNFKPKMSLSMSSQQKAASFSFF